MAKTNASAPPFSDAAVVKATGRNWDQWRALLDRKGAASLSHRDLARLISTLHSGNGWWSQAVAVGYERITGKRKRHARADGTFNVSASKTMAAKPTEVFKRIADDRMRSRWAPASLKVLNVRKTKVARIVHFRYGKKSPRVFAYLEPRKDRTVVTISVEKLPSAAAVALQRKRWRAGLDKLAGALARD
jgi:hypothetical protein